MILNKKPLLIILAVVATILVFSVIFYWKNLRGIWPALIDSEIDIVERLETTPGPGLNNTQFPLQLQPGFKISIWGKDLVGARVLAFDDFGNAWLSQTKQGRISFLEVKDGSVVRKDVVLNGLKNPHGLAFDPTNKTKLYIAAEDKIIELPTYSDQRTGDAIGSSRKLVDLPQGGRHTTRTLGFSSTGKLFVSIGSTCDVCREENDKVATIQKVDIQTGQLSLFAKGLRNTVFFTFHPKTGEIWGTEMGRDHLGDDLPPDEINIIKEGKNYGWPTCYGKNIHDTEFDKNTYIRNPCLAPFEDSSHIDLQAHSAPLGLAFIPSENSGPIPAVWPKEYQGDLLVAYHGSWNRSVPTGYKIVRIKLNDSGQFEGIEDFISGWLDEGASLGRPVDLKFGPDGSLYVTDDKAGVVYKVSYQAGF